MEDEMFLEIRQGKDIDEPCLFPKNEWDSLIKWQPVSNIPTDEIYKNLPEAKAHAEMYERLWLKNKGRC